MKKLGFGLMRLPLLDEKDDSSVDIEQVKKMVDTFIEKGFTYFDTAWMYHRGTSENVVKEALTSRYPRDAYTIATKMHMGFVKKPEDLDAIFAQQLEKCGVEFFDYYLLHDMNGRSFAKAKRMDAFNWILEKKRQGLVRRIGFSFHDSAEVLGEVLDAFPEAEFVQIQLNYIDWESEGIQSRRCYETVVSRGKKVVVMEPVKGGTLANVPEEAEHLMRGVQPGWSIPSWAIRFAASLPEVMVVLSGMSSLAQMEDNTEYMENFHPLGQTEQDVIKKVVEIFNGRIIIPCTACAYCTTVCPQSIPIFKYFSLYNADNQELETKGFTSQKFYYGTMSHSFAKASDCIKCGACEALCPQHLPIRKLLEDVAAYFE